MTKRIVAVAATAMLGLGFAAAAAAPAQAVSCKAFNQGTGNAAHVAGASGNGLVMIAEACHGF